MDCLRNVIGQRQTEKALQLGTLFSCDDALRVGLVDEVVSESETLDAARRQLASWNKVPCEFTHHLHTSHHGHVVDLAHV